MHVLWFSCYLMSLPVGITLTDKDIASLYLVIAQVFLYAAILYNYYV